MFYDRQAELALLRQKHSALSSGQLVVVYGRRRVGKTELLTKLLAEVGGVYLYIDMASPADLLRHISRDIREQTGQFVELGDWEMFLEWLAGRRGLVVLDEFQRLATIDAAYITRLQRAWDLQLKDRPLMLVLCGSSLGMMRKVALKGTAPLYGRITTLLKLSPFGYRQVRSLFPDLPERDRILYYSVFGGTPHYLSFVLSSRERGIAPLIEKLLLAKGSPLLEEPLNLLQSEVKETARYNSILAGLAGGKQTLKELADRTGIGATNLMYYLENLQKLLDLVEVKAPLQGKRRMGRYRIKDNFFRFYYRFIVNHRSALERGELDGVSSTIQAQLATFSGPVFEDIVRELLTLYNHDTIHGFPLAFDEIGAWWDRKGNEIDLCAPGKKEILLGEVKFTGKPMGVQVLDSLIEKADLVQSKLPKRYLLVCAGGFTPKCRSKAARLEALCLDLKDLAALFEARG